jgi:transcriptional regulator with XRE-family HTH domain
MIPVASFAERFRELTKGQTCRQVSDRLDIGKSTVSAYANGDRTPKGPVLMTIARVYNVDPMWLMGYDVPREKETPDINDGGLTQDQSYILEQVKQMTPDELQSLRNIVDQVLFLRGK